MTELCPLSLEAANAATNQWIALVAMIGFVVILGLVTAWLHMRAKAARLEADLTILRNAVAKGEYPRAVDIAVGYDEGSGDMCALHTSFSDGRSNVVYLPTKLAKTGARLEIEPTQDDFDQAARIWVEESIIDEVAFGRAKIRFAVGALQTVRRSLTNGQASIACTVWADGSPAETLLDHVDTALDMIAGPGASN